MRHPHVRQKTPTIKANNRCFAEQYDTPITRLRMEDDIFPIEKAVRGPNPPGRTEYRAARQAGGPDQTSRATGGQGR